MHLLNEHIQIQFAPTYLQISDAYDLPDSWSFSPRKCINFVLSVGLFNEENLQKQEEHVKVFLLTPS